MITDYLDLIDALNNEEIYWEDGKVEFHYEPSAKHVTIVIRRFLNGVDDKISIECFREFIDNKFVVLSEIEQSGAIRLTYAS